MQIDSTAGNNFVSENEKNIEDDESVVRNVIAKCATEIYADGRNVHVQQTGTRIKNREFMYYHRYFYPDIAGILSRLKIWQYSYTSKKEGCEDAYCFGITDHKLDIYIKFSFVAGQNVVTVNVFSFHDPDYTMTFPYIQFKLLECGKK